MNRDGTIRFTPNDLWFLCAGGVALGSIGLYGDTYGWWASHGYLANTVASLTLACFGVPIAVHVTQRVSAEQSERRTVRELYRRLDNRLYHLQRDAISLFGEPTEDADVEVLASAVQVVLDFLRRYQHRPARPITVDEFTHAFTSLRVFLTISSKLDVFTWSAGYTPNWSNMQANMRGLHASLQELIDLGERPPISKYILKELQDYVGSDKGNVRDFWQGDGSLDRLEELFLMLHESTSTAKYPNEPIIGSSELHQEGDEIIRNGAARLQRIYAKLSSRQLFIDMARFARADLQDAALLVD